MAEKGKPRIRREMLSPYEMSLVQTAFGMSAQHTTSEALREALVKIAKKLTNFDRMIVEEGFASCCPGSGGSPHFRRKGNMRRARPPLASQIGQSLERHLEAVKRPLGRFPIAAIQSHGLVRAEIGDVGPWKREGTNRHDAV